MIHPRQWAVVVAAALVVVAAAVVVTLAVVVESLRLILCVYIVGFSYFLKRCSRPMDLWTYGRTDGPMDLWMDLRKYPLTEMRGRI